LGEMGNGDESAEKESGRTRGEEEHVVVVVVVVEFGRGVLLK